MKNKYYCGKCEHIGMYTGSYTHSEKLCKRYAAILKVDGNDVEKCVPCICETLEAENAALKNKIQSVKEVFAKYLADLFGCPCNYSSLDEEMANYCGDECNMNDDVDCWLKVFRRDDALAAEAKLKELQGEEE